MELAEVRTAVARFAASFDPSRVSADDAARVVRDVAAMEGMLAAVKARAAARAAESAGWRSVGARSAAERLGRQIGVGTAQAREVIDVGRRLDELPAVRDAALRGELSAPQTLLVTDAAGADPGSERRLLETARSASLGELRAECLAVKAAADADLEARRARIHAARSLRSYTDRAGAAHLHLTDNPEVVAEAVALIAPVREELFRAARRGGHREPAEALDADALVETLRRAAAGSGITAESGAATGPRDPAGSGAATDLRIAAGSGAATGPRDAAGSGAAPASPRRLRAAKVIVRVDWDALLRGYPARGEVCQVMGQPIAVSAVRDMLAAGGFLAAVVTKGERVVGVAHLGRAPTARQDTALDWLYPACAVRGCGRRVRLERDHRRDWARGRITLLEQLDLLCSHHHALKTRHGWGLVDGHGTRDFVPPDDARHPRHTSPAA